MLIKSRSNDNSMSFSHQSNCWSKIKFPHKYHISMDILKTLHVQFCLCKTSSAYFQVLAVRCLQSFMHTPIEKKHPLLLVMDRSLLIQLILGVQILISAWQNFPNLLTLQILGGKISNYRLSQTASAFWCEKPEEWQIYSCVFSDESLVPSYFFWQFQNIHS